MSTPRNLVAMLPCVAITWLGLAAPTAMLRAQSAVEPSPRPAIVALLARLDACFAARDLDGYLAAFTPDHPAAQAVRRLRLEPMFAADRELVRRSTIGSDPRTIGPRTVVRVHHEVRCAKAGTKDAPVVWREDTMLAVRGAPDGTVAPTFEVEIPVETLCQRGDLFRCPPCNYEVGGTPGWLCVPMRGDRAHALEAATFFLIGTDVACDISVQIDTDAPSAEVVARRLAKTMLELAAGAVLGEPSAWLPKAHATAVPRGLVGARLDVTLPRDVSAAGGSAAGVSRGGEGRATFHVVTFGGLQHILLVRGSATALQQHTGAVAELLGSYRLLDEDADHALAAAEPLHHHTGGLLQGSTYRNEPYDVLFQGPEGWAAQQRCGGAAFRVVWSSTTGGRIHLIGYRVPAGLPAWSPATADRWFRQLCTSAGLDVGGSDVGTSDVGTSGAGASGSGTWTVDPAGGGQTRTVQCATRDDQAGDKAGQRPRVIRLLVRDKLLLVADGQAGNAAEEAAVQAALASLRRP